MNYTTFQDFSGLIGRGITYGFGGSITLMALFVVGGIAFVMWFRRGTMQETYFFTFIALGLLRIYSDNSAFNDKGIFGMLHNLFLLASAFIWAKILTSGTNR